LAWEDDGQTYSALLGSRILGLLRRGFMVYLADGSRDDPTSGPWAQITDALTMSYYGLRHSSSLISG